MDDDDFKAIKIDGYRNTWSALEGIDLDDASYILFENDKYGDMTCYLVVKYLDDMPDEVFETYDGLIQCLTDESII